MRAARPAPQLTVHAAIHSTMQLNSMHANVTPPVREFSLNLLNLPCGHSTTVNLSNALTLSKC
jgi:hypothetical protein